MRQLPMKKIILLIIVLAAGIALGIHFQRQSKVQDIENKAKQDAGLAGDAVKAGIQKVDAAAATVKTNIEIGMQKSESLATNVAAHVKAGAQKVGEVATNAVEIIKEKLP
jgi:hypothetical protein